MAVTDRDRCHQRNSPLLYRPENPRPRSGVARGRSSSLGPRLFEGGQGGRRKTCEALWTSWVYANPRVGRSHSLEFPPFHRGSPHDRACCGGRSAGVVPAARNDEEVRLGRPPLLVVLRLACRAIEAVAVSSKAASTSRAGSSACRRSPRPGLARALGARPRAARWEAGSRSTATASANGRCAVRPPPTRLRR